MRVDLNLNSNRRALAIFGIKSKESATSGAIGLKSSFFEYFNRLIMLCIDVILYTTEAWLFD
jgi:hypothetical protein